MTVGPPPLWAPHPGPQTRFLSTRANEVLYGGAAGGGKSAGLIALPLRWIKNPNFSAIVLRRDTTQLKDLLRKAAKIYPANLLRGKPVSDGSSVTWRFPSGATIRFTHCQHESDAARFDGDEFQVVEFDELTHFTERQYLALRARIRSPDPTLPRYSRATTNPGGEGHAWVFARWGAWLDPDFKILGLPPGDGKTPPAAPGQVLFFVRLNGIEQVVPEGTLGDPDEDGLRAPALSRTFIPARLSDNPSIAVSDPGYIANLDQMDPVRREQLRNGNWLVSYSAGTLFQRGWFEIVDARPAAVVARCRVWDRAATKPSTENKDPDWTRGALVSRTAEGLFFIEDMASTRDRPMAVDHLMRTTAELDGKLVPIVVFQDPGSAGVGEADAMVRSLSGWNVRVVKVGKTEGDKVTRAKPASAQAERRNIKLIRGAWNKSLLEELEAFPSKGWHDDQVDVLSTGVSVLSESTGLARLRMLATQ